MRLRLVPSLVAALLKRARQRLGLFALFFVFVAGAALGGGYTALAEDVSSDPGAISAASSSDSTSTADESATSTTVPDLTTVDSSTEIVPTTTDEPTVTDGSGSATEP